MPNFYDILRFGDIFTPQQPSIISDDPARGGITGNLPMPRMDIFKPGQVDPRVNLETGAGTYTGQPMTRDFNYEPERQASDALMGHLGQMPQRPNPGVLQKIIASFVGMGAGPQAADQALYGGYNRDLQDWDVKRQGLTAAAQEEGRRNTSEASWLNRDVANQIALERLRNQQDRLELDALKNAQIYEVKVAELEQKASIADQNLELARQRAEFNRDNAQAQLAFREAQLDAQNARHQADIARRDAQIEINRATAEARIRDLEEKNKLAQARIDAGKEPVTRTETVTGPSGETRGTRTTTTSRGSIPQQGPPSNMSSNARTMERTVRHRTTGQVKKQISTDGGKTWKDK